MENENPVVVEESAASDVTVGVEETAYNDIMDDVFDTEEPADQPSSEEENDESEADTDEEVTETTEGSTEEFSLPVKHLDDSRNLTRDEAIEYAQKGMDYDRVKGKNAELASQLSQYEFEHKFLESIRGDLPDIKALMVDTKKQIYMSQGKSEDEATRLATDEFKDMPAPKKLLTAEEEREENRRKSFDKIAKLYPDIKPENITKEMWDDLNNTDNLVASYLRAENKELKAKLAVYEKNEKNKNRSSGSMKSNGGGKSGYKSIVDDVFSNKSYW